MRVELFLGKENSQNKMSRERQLVSPLTRLELQVMLVLWDCERGSVRLVQGELGKRRAYNTVQTVLNILERKGRVRRVLKGRAYEYVPTLSYQKSIGRELKDLIDRMFSGSADKLITALVQSGLMTADCLRALGERAASAETEL